MGRDCGHIPDERIVRDVVDGDTALFRIIVERYQKRVFAVGMRFFGNHDDALDFAQEVFIRAYDRLGSFRGESRFYSWIIKLAYNHGINSLRKRVQVSGLVESYIDDSRAGPETAHLRREVRRALQEAVAALPERYRMCLDLFFFLGLTYPEISDITGFPVNTIKSHVRRAKMLLRDALKGTVAEDYDEM